MRGFPQELVFALVFGAIWLVQIVYRILRRKATSMQAELEAQPAVEAMTPAPTETAPRPTTLRITPAPLGAAPRRAPRARRFSRAALMPDRRAMQDAFVIAAILQPCHANRARDIE